MSNRKTKLLWGKVGLLALLTAFTVSLPQPVSAGECPFGDMFSCLNNADYVNFVCRYGCYGLEEPGFSACTDACDNAWMTMTSDCFWECPPPQ